MHKTWDGSDPSMRGVGVLLYHLGNRESDGRL